MLLTARRVSAAFGVLCCLFGFCHWLFLLQCVDWPDSYAPVADATNYSIVSATRATTDVHSNFFLLSLALSTVFILYRVHEIIRDTSELSYSGILTGLAAAVKITGIIIGGSLFFVAIILYKVL